MVPFLSSEWLTAFDSALRGNGDLGTRFASTPLTIAQEVAVDDETTVRYVVVLDRAGGRLETDAAVPADLTFVCDRDTAAGLAQGTLNAQGALTSGRLKLRGEVDRLAAAAPALAELGDVLAALRADTEF